MGLASEQAEEGFHGVEAVEDVLVAAEGSVDGNRNAWGA
jgi:hypothetical protein